MSKTMLGLYHCTMHCTIRTCAHGLLSCNPLQQQCRGNDNAKHNWIDAFARKHEVICWSCESVGIALQQS